MKNKGFGLAIAFVLALCAMLLGTFFPIIGSSVFALILGIVLNELVDLPENSRPGLNWSGKKLLQHVEQITFSGSYARKVEQPVLYITERAVFELTAEGVELKEIVPGVDLEKDRIRSMIDTIYAKKSTDYANFLQRKILVIG